MSEIWLVDLDSVEIVTAVERAFRIKIDNAEAAGCQTVGDLFGLVARKVPTVDRNTTPCPTASAFWRLRGALRTLAPNQQIRPSTPLADVMPASRRGAWWRQLGNTVGLVMPSARPPAASRRSWLVLGTVYLVSFGIGLACGAGPWSVLVGFAAALVFGLSGSLRRSDVLGMGVGATVGDLARITASLNAGLVTERSGPMRRSEACTALEGVIRNFTHFAGPIERRTRFRCG
jgi:hypothetical protein